MIRISTWLAILLLGTLACNHIAWPAAGMIAVTALVAAVEVARTRRVPREAWLFLMPVAWWTLSFALTRESWSVFFSPEFLRRDGAMLISMLPMAALAALPIDRARLWGALAIYLAFQAAVAVVGAVSAVGGWHSAFFHTAAVVDQQPTFFGLFVAHNATASVYLLLALGALAWSMRTDRNLGFRAALVFLLALGCILARSRGAFLALVLGAGCVTALAIQRRAPARAILIGLAGVVLAGLVGGAMLLPRFQRMTEKGADSFRKAHFQMAWQHFKSSPVIGIGYGRYNDEYREFTSMGIGRVATKATVVNNDRHAHNSYLHWLAEGGVVGLAVMIAFWILVARSVRGDDLWRDWILAGIMAMAVLSLTEHYAGGGIFLAHLALLIGIRQSREIEA